MSKRKSLQLECNVSTAANRLRKLVLFDLVKKLNLDVCFRCGIKIESAKELSIDHKIAWLDANNPVEVFYDLNNVAFSHLNCNTQSRRTPLVVRSNSGFKGVGFNNSKKHKKKYVAELAAKVDGVIVKHKLGRFDTAEKAALAYDLKAKEILGSKAVTNTDLGLILSNTLN